MSHTSGRLKNKLIKGQAFSSFLMNSSSCSFSKSEGSHCQFGDLKQSLVIGHGSNDHGDSIAILNVMIRYEFNKVKTGLEMIVNGWMKALTSSCLRASLILRLKLVVCSLLMRSIFLIQSWKKMIQFF